ncbi:EAL domain-containing protein [Paenibacillus agricola]|uniref:EAL domain-containing protein n=1 Tax=Paenibacillus agricola TaxID=2716264 RepID=A0ABX0J938_9BACL|nr:EAL domain-containing protein [Paenibacillus agricola]NHN32483.1 EAL domain-containing protein [Paenibacillus agricola]
MIRIDDLDYALESRQLCTRLGMNPKEIPFPKRIMTAEDLETKRKEYEEILSVVHFFGDKILTSLQGTPLLLSVADENGYIVHMMGDEMIKSTINQLGIRVGVQFTEEDMGTNVVSLSLKHTPRPIELIGNDHYHEYLHQSACYAIAFHYTDNNLLGSIIIMTAIQFQNPMMITMLSTAVDSIERELLLRKQNRTLDLLNQIIMDNTRNGIVFANTKGEVIGFNQSAQTITGFSKEQIMNKPVQLLKPIGSYIADVIQYERKFEDIQVNIKKNKLVCLFDAFPLYDFKKELIGAFGQFRDITERYQAEERYNYLANHDDLTKLPNRRYYKKQAIAILNQAKRKPSEQVAFLYLDLDRFKLVNDTLGHSHGDLLLIQVTERFLQCMEPGDLVARMSGDEFMFVLPHVTETSQIIQLAERLLNQFLQPINMNGYQFHITASIGISIYPDDGMDIEALMIHADTAMYSAKGRGKNRYAFYSEEMNTKSHEKITMEASLRKALEHEEFRLYYQPQVDIKTGEIKGVEALIRWQHPERGLVSPAEFIPLAEETGLILQIDEWVLHTAVRDNKRWQALGLPAIRVAVNLSPQQFSNERLVEIVSKTLEESGLDPKYLELEITETMTMDVEHTIPKLKQLHDLGVQISIDDFGTGYSSLNYLKKFSIDRLKIDQSFVRDIISDRNDADIVGTIIAMAHNLGLEVIAEGVEEKDQLRFLQYQKCNEVQGYYFCRPIPSSELEQNFTKLREEFINKY